MAKPGFYWYSGDWKKDTCMLSLIAKGGWHELLLTLNDTQGTVTWPIETYARFWSVGVEVAVEIIEELERYKVADVEWLSTGLSTAEPATNGQQTLNKASTKGQQISTKISCRRMVRAAQNKEHIRLVRSVAGKKSAEKKQQKQQSSFSSSLNLNKSRMNDKNHSSPRAQQKTGSNFREFSDYFCAAFLTKFGEKYIFQQAKDAGSIKRMLVVCELRQLEDLADRFFASPDPFIRQSGYTLGVFESQLKKLSIAGSKETVTGWEELRKFADDKK